MEQLFDKFSDLPALEKEKERILNIFLDIKKGIISLSEMGIKIDASKGVSQAVGALKEYQDLQDKITASQKLLAQAEANLAEARKRGNAETQSSIGALGKYNDTIGGNVQKLDALKTKLAQTNADMKKLSDFKDAAGGSKQFNDELTKLGVTQFELKKQISETTRFIKNQTQEAISAEGSVVQLRGRLNQLLQTFDELSGTNQEGAIGQGLLKDIDTLTAKITTQEEASKRFQRNVGNYQGSAKIIVDALKTVETEITNLAAKQKGLQDFSQRDPIGFKMQGGGEQLKDITNQLGFATKQATALSGVVDKPTFLKVAGKVGDATAEVKAFTKTLVDLENQGLKESEVYGQVQARLAELTDTISDTKQSIKALGSDTREFDLFASSVGTLSSVFQTAASGAQLFGKDSDDVQKSIQKLMAIQAVSNGVRQIATDLTTRGSAANKLYAAAQGQVAIFTNASATATQRFGAALKLSGVGLLIAAVGFLADKLGLFGSATSQADKDLANFDLELERSNSLATRNITLLERQTEKMITLAKTVGKSDSDINAITVNGLQKQAQYFENLAAARKASTASSISNFAETVSSYKEFDNIDIMKQLGLDDLKTKGIPTLEKANEILDNIDKLKTSKTFDSFYDRQKKSLELVEKNIKAQQDALSKADEKSYASSSAKDAFVAQEAEKDRQNAKEESEANSKARFDVLQASLTAEYAARKTALQKIADLNKAIAEADTTAIPKLRIDARNREFEAEKKIIEQDRDLTLRSNADKVASINSLRAIRLAAAKDEGERAHINADANAEVKAATITSAERKNVYADAADKIRALESKLVSDIIAIRAKAISGSKEEALAAGQERQARVDAQAKQYADEYAKRQDTIDKFTAKENLATNARYEKELADAGNNQNKKNAIIAKYAEQQNEDQIKYQKAQIASDIVFYEQQLDLLNAAGLDTLSTEKELAAAKLHLSQLNFDSTVAIEQKRADLVAQLSEKYKDLATTIASTFSGAIDNAYDSQKQKLQDQLDLIDQIKQQDIDRVNASGDAEQKKAERVKLIEAKAQSDREMLAKRQKDIDIRKAEFDKAFKAMQVVTDGIQAVNKIKLAVLAEPNLLLKPIIAAQIPIALATSAAELVAILATPIPKYATGVVDSPAGLALVGEAGRELGIDPKGRLTMYNEPTLANLAKGTTILPNRVTEDLLQATESGRQMALNASTKQGGGNGAEVALLGAAVQQLKEISKKSGIIVNNTPGIETSAYYLQQMKH